MEARGLGIQGHPQLHIKFENSLIYVRPYLLEKNEYSTIRYHHRCLCIGENTVLFASGENTVLSASGVNTVLSASGENRILSTLVENRVLWEKVERVGGGVRHGQC